MPRSVCSTIWSLSPSFSLRRARRSFDRMRPSELPIFLIWTNSPSAVFRGISFMAKTPLYGMYNRDWCPVQQMFYAGPTSTHRFQLVDHARDHRQPAVPEFGIPGIEPKRLEQLGIMLGAAGREHRQIALCKPALRVFVDRIERVHEAIAEGIGVDVERRMDEVRDIHPETLVAGPDVDRGAEALALHL